MIEEWRKVFWITFAVLIATTLVYLFWASGEIQSWNDNTKEDNWLRRLCTSKRKDGTEQTKIIEENSESNVVNQPEKRKSVKNTILISTDL